MKIFKKVHCKAYLKKQSDGIMLSCYKDYNEFEFPLSGVAWEEPVKVIAHQNIYQNGEWKDVVLADLSDFEGSTVEKIYRTRVEEEFDGFLVGITQIVTNGRIGTDMDMVPYNIAGDLKELYHLVKYTHKEKVGVVYFKNNARRYVLIDDIEG